MLNFTFIPIIYFFFPETAGLSLEALDVIFDVDGWDRGVLNKAHRRRMREISREATTTGTGELHFDAVGDTKVSTAHVEEDSS